jgi:LysM repeat protein
MISIGQRLQIPGAAASASTPPATTNSGGGTTTPASGTYTVQSGDSLWSLARRWGTTVDEIADLNGISDPAAIRIGDILRIP